MNLAASFARLAAMSTTVLRVIAYGIVGIMCAVGVILLAIALRSAVDQAMFVHDAVRANGTIIDVRCTSKSLRHGYQCTPVFRFTSNDGQMYMILSRTGGNFNDFRVGTPVAVLYLSDHPATAQIDSFAQMWAFAVIFAVLGLVILFFPLQILRAQWRQRRLTAGIT